jgi:segregation and condensation protein A
MAKAKQAKNVTTATLDEADDDARRDSYRVKLEMFEGPLDLLLYLIKKDEIDIKNIPVAHITEQYLAYLALMQELDIAVAGDFLVMASTLIYIKSKMLLPPDPFAVAGEEDLNEDPRAELVERLLEYQKFKSAANMLYEKGELEAARYTRGEIETDKSNPEISATMFDLLRVFREILKRAEAEAELEIHRDEVTMSSKVAQIRAALAEAGELNVRDLFLLAKSKRELIVTFLVLLELVKYAEISLVQREVFGEIFARRRDSSVTPAEIVDTYEKPAESEAEAMPEAAVETPVGETEVAVEPKVNAEAIPQA